MAVSQVIEILITFLVTSIIFEYILSCNAVFWDAMFEYALGVRVMFAHCE
jgi:Na+-transporting NADH:ubiquinone oxidoreductase subunit NqrB